jgi:hypothetical protein
MIEKIHAIFAEVEEIEKELDRIQNHWFLQWFTLRKQGKLISRAYELLDRSENLLAKFSE